ncbi:MAG: hypothetical protein IPL61_04830 [Myxococcales bacterium]|nr:hypothetical protein [Myxococcales bacterium]
MVVRLGEILVAAGWVDPAAVDAALTHQRQHGRRLGAILVEAGLVEADDIARGLARQRGVPAALERHLSQRDPALVSVLPGALAVGIGAVPVAWSRGAQGMSLVVCFRDPTPANIAEVARVTGVPVIPAVACEVVISREIALAYAAAAAAAVPDGVADVDAAIDVNFDEPSAPAFNLVDLDDGRVHRDASQTQLSSARAGGLLPTTPPPVAAPVAPRATPPPVPPPVPRPAPSKAATCVALAEAGERDQVADLAIAFARGAWRGAVVLIVREGLAVGHRGFGGNATEAALAGMLLPLAPPSMFATVHDEQRTLIGAPPPGNLAQSRFLKLFEAIGPAPVVLIPVTVRQRVVSLVFAIAPLGSLAPAAAALGEVAQAMGEAYERLIREAKGL